MTCLRVILLWLCFDQSFGVKFSIIHNNDMLSRYDPISETYDTCKSNDDDRGICFGGFARVATYINQARSKGSVLYLNAGNTFQGTSWFKVYKGRMVAEMLNMLKPDAVCLGNHEFDDGIDGLLPFLDNLKAPVVCCNLDFRKEPSLKEHKKIRSSIVVNRFDTKIGIVGYLTPNTEQKSQKNYVEYHKEIEAINEETRELVKQGVNIIIALGNSGYSMDQEIASNCPDVDVVVGGHSRTFLFNGAPPGNEKPDGPYPTIVTKSSGLQVPVVQAFAYTKYIGKIDLEFDDQGILVNFQGTPILLDKRIPKQADITTYLDKRREAINDMENNVIGTTLVYLNGQSESCRKEECNLGNLIADSFVYARAVQNARKESWTDASIAIMNAGGIRASIDPGDTGVVTSEDIATILPFRNELYYTQIKGKQLMEIFEYSAKLRHKDLDGGFLQVSGIRVNFNFNRPRGKRITSMLALCTTCKVPFYERVERDNIYRIILTNFLLSGGDGHKLKDPDKPDYGPLKVNDSAAVLMYFQQHKIVYPMLEKRITNVEKNHTSSFATRTCGGIQLIVIVLFLHCTFSHCTKFIF